ncbi:hypothetical protein PEDI_48430 [Persicobacter diffluens]|uniref:Glycoside hydrolase family 42 N-terminal domain-containing protein n=2 Tax=Persicobacter diffluens TaxID=981 RepID=A0AAN4W411_9BACT|nr:hypothetical protein PEDI_48430 [Persicobacter diffluens]
MNSLPKLIFFALLMGFHAVHGQHYDQTLKKQVTSEIKALQKAIEKAEAQGIDCLKEKMTLRTAEVFAEFADWDEAHPAENVRYFKMVHAYKNKADSMATVLPSFERQEILLMLDDAQVSLENLCSGAWSRPKTPKVRWDKVTLEKDQLTFNHQPVFLADWTWKPKTEALQEYYGQLNGFFISPNYLLNEQEKLSPRANKELANIDKKEVGFVFMNHKTVPDWAKKKYGDGFSMREDTYTAYDIDHPGAREMQEMLLGKIVPQLSGKSCSALGYMLCNEPHFYTTKDAWATGPVSDYTMEKFKAWLQQKHGNIQHLNELWHSSFQNFETVKLEIPIAEALQGTAQWYDWVTFNNQRVTEWFQFLKSTTLKYDPEAKVHLKVMPQLWTQNRRNHGLDFEALMELSDIIGNDVGAAHHKLWGKPDQWESKYSFDWRDMCMSYDFFKSLHPEKMVFNTETHYLSTNRSRKLDMSPKYVRMAYWWAHLHGLDASQAWYWARMADGAPKHNAGKGYAASNNHQPRVVNEVTATLMDLNTHSEAIKNFQRQEKPVRIFYSETSATQKADHMDQLFELYESLYFEGLPIGFATAHLMERTAKPWPVVLIKDTPRITAAERECIQAYLKKGGEIITDGKSLKSDEYGRPFPAIRHPGLKTLPPAQTFQKEVSQHAALKAALPKIKVVEENGKAFKTVAWKSMETPEGKLLFSVANFGKDPVDISFRRADGTPCTAVTDMNLSFPYPAIIQLKKYESIFVEVDPEKQEL